MHISMPMYICIYAGILCIYTYGMLSSNRTKYCGIFMNQTDVNFQICYLEGYNRGPQIYKDTHCVNPLSGPRCKTGFQKETLRCKPPQVINTGPRCKPGWKP